MCFHSAFCIETENLVQKPRQLWGLEQIFFKFGGRCSSVWGTCEVFIHFGYISANSTLLILGIAHCITNGVTRL